VPTAENTVSQEIHICYVYTTTEKEKGNSSCTALVPSLRWMTLSVRSSGEILAHIMLMFVFSTIRGRSGSRDGSIFPSFPHMPVRSGVEHRIKNGHRSSGTPEVKVCSNPSLDNNRVIHRSSCRLGTTAIGMNEARYEIVWCRSRAIRPPSHEQVWTIGNWRWLAKRVTCTRKQKTPDLR